MANRLASASSPYLRQHQDNPVAWWEWGDDAFEEARRRDVPVLVSIGYATCHWCHVMAHEVFEDAEAAALLNDAFVCIKVDREERPDVDDLYMAACQAMTGAGGWPLNVLATHDRRPFFAATYIPKQSRHQRLGIMDLVPRVLHLWETRREDLEAQADAVLERIMAGPPDGEPGQEATTAPLGAGDVQRCAQQLMRRHDAKHGGFGTRPKFPSAHNLLLLLRAASRAEEAATTPPVDGGAPVDDRPRADDGATKLAGAAAMRDAVANQLRQMARGGIRDHLAGGFHRYSTDAAWLLPHFEKMLYDQAMLAYTYAEASTALDDPQWLAIANQTVAYVLGNLADGEGGFHCALDADSEGEEGRHYLWTWQEVREALGRGAASFAAAYDVRPEGNHLDEATGRPTGRNVLHRLRPAPGADEDALAVARARLLEVRHRRPRPELDDKVLTDWNGLWLAALARVHRAGGGAHCLDAARRLASFLRGRMRRPDGTLRHRYRDGHVDERAFLDDHAYLLWGLVEMHQATHEAQHLAWAVEVADALETRFCHPGGAYSLSPAGHPERLPSRPPDAYDGALPNGNGVAAWNLLRLGLLTGDTRWTDAGRRVMDALAPAARAAPHGSAALHIAADLDAGPATQVVLVGKRSEVARFEQVLAGAYRPRQVVLLSDAAHTPLAPWTVAMTRPGAYVCRAQACQAPVQDADALRRALQDPPPDAP